MILPDGLAGVAFGTSIDGDPRLDDAARIAASETLAIPAEWAWVCQVHGSEVVAPTGSGIGPEADGMVTTDSLLPIAVSVADCLPVALIADGAVGMAHAGWRGAAGGVVSSTIGALTDLGHPPHTVVIGPGIGPCCFEVGDEVAARFPKSRARTRWGTESVNLSAAVAGEVEGLAVRFVSACTYHDQRFHSYRRDGTGRRQFGVAWVTAD